jgi:voltage-gated potassium channel
LSFLVRLLRARPHRHALFFLAGVVGCVLVGGAVFAVTQHLAITSGWYWALETATTVGYGDVTPHNATGRIVASLVMLTTIPMLAAAFALVTGSAVARGVRRIMELGARFPEGSYRLVLGMHSAIPVVLEELANVGDSVVLVADVDPSTVPAHVHLVRADPTSEEGIRSGRPEGAVHILIAAEDDGDVLVSAILVREEAPDVPVTALVSSRRLIRALRDIGVSQVLSPDDLVGHTVAKGLEAPHAGELLTHLVRGREHRLVEHIVEQGAEPCRLSEVRKARPGLILGVVQRGAAVSLGVAEDPEVGPGDVLLVVEPNGTPHHHRGIHGAAVTAGKDEEPAAQS